MSLKPTVTLDVDLRNVVHLTDDGLMVSGENLTVYLVTESDVHAFGDPPDRVVPVILPPGTKYLALTAMPANYVPPNAQKES